MVRHASWQLTIPMFQISSLKKVIVDQYFYENNFKYFNNDQLLNNPIDLKAFNCRSKPKQRGFKLILSLQCNRGLYGSSSKQTSTSLIFSILCKATSTLNSVYSRQKKIHSACSLAILSAIRLGFLRF
ncbi:uncharacterized protein EV154DRAFT_546808 [Mucor mucedo]|uniref:uncharacterized protein n=1 Tax=Mucor mucedo TaxID=29922 RepID=UPI00222121AD|nr:uncharacterized protein EV154DRAFT_546808 [Mucor mucedo]KAI7897418.1 hypothetical protein EV154DRAFT_546808 [Mucor mucedo]